MLERLNRPLSRRRLAVLAAAGAALALSAGLPAPSMAQDEAARTEALRTRVEAIAAEAQRVEDINAVARLQRAYGYYIDKGFWDEAADMFADDGTLEIGVDGVYVGRARVREAIIAYGEGVEGTGPGLRYGQINHRMQLSPVVTVAEDGETAYGRWKEWALLGDFKVEARWGDATVENVYVKDDGVWKIQTMRIYTNFVAPYEGGWAALPPVDGGDWKTAVAERLPPDAPPTATYDRFPAVFVPPFHYDLTTPASVADLSGAAPGADDLGALEAAADRVAARVTLAASERAIENLQAQYGYYVDKGMWTEASNLFSEDGTWEFGQSGVYVGRDRVKDGLSLMGPEGLEEGQLNNYPMMQPIVTVAPDNRTAVARWRSDVMLSRAGKGRWGGGLYQMEYVNEGGVWKIAKLHYYVTFWGDYDEGWQAHPFPMDPPSTSNPPDQPPTEVYASLPTAHFVPYHYENPVSRGTPILSIEIPDVRGRALRRIAEDLSEIEARAMHLVDQTAVERLQHTYGYYVDQAQWHDVADLWAVDGTLEIGGRGVFLGKERVREYMLTAFGQPGRQNGSLIDHQQFQVLATVNPDGRTAEARAVAFVMSSGGWGDCYYENDYEKIDGVWHMKVLHGPFNMYSGYDIGWLDRVITNTFPEKFGVPPDLPPSVVYLAYPSYYAEPFHYPHPVTGLPARAPDPTAGGEAFGRLEEAWAEGRGETAPEDDGAE